ncbi:hypothetical protein G5C60_37535 [Streptomyces sp. HC44]|uniref:GNAT family N-acetyltransferase n=1 Tax=Streptomyces scabichelini TaxID=2711217 RepID=A0A6G4VGC0_9ACTN|nr:hypothetical protein [Streptomyces scabichelini]NGO13149.1 hypothetical protein [Streptomyces scabichelini]
MSSRSHPSPPTTSSTTARQDADEAAAGAAVTVRPVSEADACVDASRLLARVFGTSYDASPVQHDVLRSLAHAGGCVIGAYRDGRLVGTAACVAGAPHSTDLYSLIAGVDADVTGGGIGYALKLAQRAWGLDRGATTMRWTFDPLLRRNAYFNLTRLGAVASAYIPDFYAPLNDAVNRNDLTDRLVARWTLDRPVGARPPAEEPADARTILRPVEGLPVLGEPDGEAVLKLWVPRDAEALRGTSPDRARRWRHAVREAFTAAVDQGYTARGMTRDGWYLLVRDTRAAQDGPARDREVA